ncbi:hypothetical protein N7447_003326 [Penicillium robsamsonii]|uniref:uncharacterized protein n=1 Tax=Penicillium robsamsonii TaxID=1792511 RepID=UPI0025490A33|nr:uncharacterized protein N7447_003326 [Penicillium robsamsonii]KAJ5826563.1 hypothetical protein N7447_003326 [Penicillium robsamsonii]
MSEYALLAPSSRVILKDALTWKPWIASIKGIAEQFGIWELCDPKNKTQPEVPKEPEEPSIEDAKKKHPDDWYETIKLEQAICVDPRLQAFIPSYTTPWELLRNLRQKFVPECDPIYAAQLRKRWRNLDQGLDGLDRNTDIDKWLLNWETLQARCADIGYIDAKEASIQFLHAISAMSPEFYEIWTLRLEDKKDVDFSELLTRYKVHWSISHGKSGGGAPQRSVSKATFSTRQGHEEAKPKPAKEHVPIEQRSCPCGSKSRHAPWKCWAAYESDKPAGFKTFPHLKKRWEKAMKADPAWRTFVEKKRSEMGKEKETPQADSAFESVPVRTQRMKLEYEPESEPKPVENRWVVATGAQVHVCNNRSLFVTFENARTNVKVGDTRTDVIGIGTVVIYGVSPDTGKIRKLILYETRYSPNFHTNLISHGLLTRGRVFMNFRKNWIETTDGRPIYKIYQDLNLSWFTEPGEGFQGPEELVFATKKSAREPESELQLRSGIDA